MYMNDQILECFYILLILIIQQEATSRSAESLKEIQRTTTYSRPCTSVFGTGIELCGKNKTGLCPVENDTSSHERVINLRQHLNGDDPGRLSPRRDGIPLQKETTLVDSGGQHKVQQTAEGKANGSSGSLFHLISKRDVITNNSTSKSVRRNVTLAGGKLKSTEHESHPPHYLALELNNYGGRIISMKNTEINQLTGLHIGLLLVACTGAVILLFINCVGLLCCTRYFTRRQEPDTLLDSFSTTDSGRRKWGYKAHSEAPPHPLAFSPQASFEDDPPCSETIELQSFPIRDHEAIAKTPIHSDHDICKNCNIWL